jgi:hypothetical protein
MIIIDDLVKSQKKDLFTNSSLCNIESYQYGVLRSIEICLWTLQPIGNSTIL